MRGNMYSIEELEKIFRENAVLCAKENDRALEEYKANNPGEPIPEWFTRDFCINTALAAMCVAIRDLRESVKGQR